MNSQLSVTTDFILKRAVHAHESGGTQTQFLKRLDNQATTGSSERLRNLSEALEEAIGSPEWPWT